MSVIVDEHVWITLSDGCRLGARLWLPDDARRKPVPAIVLISTLAIPMFAIASASP